MGEGAYIRIQNKSNHEVDTRLIEGAKVDENGMSSIQGIIAPGHQLPLPSNSETPFNDGRYYQYIEGDVKFFFQGHGYFHLEAHPSNGAPKSGLKLLVDSDEWWSEDPSPDEESPVLMVADVDDNRGDGDDSDNKTRIEIRIFDNYNGKRWMTQLAKHIANIPINQIGIPGSHDSGTYHFNDTLGAAPDSDLTTKINDIIGGVDALSDFILRQIYIRLCQCQTLNFKKQLEKGIRYFDMRIARHDESGTFHTCHGVYCVEMMDIIRQFQEFLDENSKVSE